MPIVLVSWAHRALPGELGYFVVYTRQINAFLPAAWAPVGAVLATVAELTLGVALAIGFRIRLAAMDAAALLLCYGVAMTISLPPAQQFHYAVFVLCTGMLALASVDGSGLSLDALLRRRERMAEAGNRPSRGLRRTESGAETPGRIK